jgi:hypothetical protein
MALTVKETKAGPRRPSGGYLTTVPVSSGTVTKKTGILYNPHLKFRSVNRGRPGSLTFGNRARVLS